MLRRLTPTERVIAWRLTEGRTVSVDEYTEALYGRRNDGGALTPREVIRQMMWRLEHELRKHDVKIVTVWGRGWNADKPHHLRDLLADELARNHRFPTPPPAPTVGMVENEAWREVERRYG